MQSSAFDWQVILAKPTDVGSIRQFFRTPTVTLDELECHVTTLMDPIARGSLTMAQVLT